MAQDYKTTKELLLSTPLPETTRTYKAVPHAQLIDLTLEGIHKAGFQITHEAYSSTSDGQIAYGKYSIGNVGDKEMNLQFTWQNSYNKKLKVKFLTGAVILVCTNGMMSFRAMNSLNNKHMGEIQTFAPRMIAQYIEKAANVFTTLQGDREAMKQVEVDRRLAATLIGRMYIENDFIESTQLNIIKRELDKPTFDYNASHSLWELFNFKSSLEKNGYFAIEIQSGYITGKKHLTHYRQ